MQLSLDKGGNDDDNGDDDDSNIARPIRFHSSLCTQLSAVCKLSSCLAFKALTQTTI